MAISLGIYPIFRQTQIESSTPKYPKKKSPKNHELWLVLKRRKLGVVQPHVWTTTAIMMKLLVAQQFAVARWQENVT